MATDNDCKNVKTNRRRSMLPQLKSTTPFVPEFGQTNDDNTSPEASSPVKQTPTIANGKNGKNSMLPPPMIKGRTSSRAQAKTSNITKLTPARPSITRTPSVEVQPIKSRSTSATRGGPPASNRAHHTRSISHQVTNCPTSTRDPSLSVTNPRRASLRLQKPSFNIHQRHYTPSNSNRRSKTSLPSYKSSSSSPATSEADQAQTIITSSLSSELLQLHLLHSVATPTLTAWTKSAEAHFKARFADLGVRSAELYAIGSEQQALINALALAEWGAGIPSTVIAEKVEVLSRDIRELEEMVRGEGKFERVRSVWEVWFQDGEKVRAERETSTENGAFVEGIGDGWKAEAMVLERELGYMRKDLEGFGEVREGSGLGRLVTAGNKLCQGLLEELDVMQWIEGEIMREEGTWMDDMVGRLGKGVSDGMTS